MSYIKINNISEGLAKLTVNANLDKRGNKGYSAEVVVRKAFDGVEEWVAEITIDDMTSQGSPEEAMDRLSLYLSSLAKVCKGKNIKQLNIGTLFDHISVK